MKKRQKKLFPALFGKTLLTLAAATAMLSVNPDTARAAESYDLWIGDTQVTSDNAANILGQTGADGNPTAKYDADTKTLYLNGVHIDKDHCYMKCIDENLTAVPDSRQSMYDDDGVICCSLYADNTIAHLVINGDNTFETPAIKGVPMSEVEKWYDEYSRLDYQLHVLDGIYVNCLSVPETSITGSGSLTSIVPPVTVEEKGDNTNKTTMSLPQNGGGGIALAWIGGDSLTIGEENGSGPTLNLFGGWCAACFHIGSPELKSTKVSVYNSEINARSDVWDKEAYGNYYAPHTTPIQAGDKCLYINPGTTLRAAKASPGWPVIPLGDLVVDEGDENYRSFYSITNQLGEAPYNGDGYNWQIFLTNEEAEAIKEANSHKKRDIDPTAESESVVDDIDVQGFTSRETVYSVDVEWGAMTFQYETYRWDPDTHKRQTGRGWLIYDNATGQKINQRRNAINRITVTNHSNADIYATFAYSAESGYEDIIGSLIGDYDDNDFSSAMSPAVTLLETADNNLGEDEEHGQGKETTKNAYFWPTGIPKTDDTVNDISKWTKIGKITVGITTKHPWA